MRVSSRLHVDDLAEALDVPLDDEVLEDVETVGGLLAKYLGKVPIPGAKVEVAGLQLSPRPHGAAATRWTRLS